MLLVPPKACSTDASLQTPLHCAKVGEVAEMLLTHGAPVNATERFGWVRFSHLYAADLSLDTLALHGKQWSRDIR